MKAATPDAIDKGEQNTCDAAYIVQQVGLSIKD
jgi:hypothetical protein